MTGRSSIQAGDATREPSRSPKPRFTLITGSIFTSAIFPTIPTTLKLVDKHAMSKEMEFQNTWNDIGELWRTVGGTWDPIRASAVAVNFEIDRYPSPSSVGSQGSGFKTCRPNSSSGAPYARRKRANVINSITIQDSDSRSERDFDILADGTLKKSADVDHSPNSRLMFNPESQVKKKAPNTIEDWRYKRRQGPTSRPISLLPPNNTKQQVPARIVDTGFMAQHSNMPLEPRPIPQTISIPKILSLPKSNRTHIIYPVYKVHIGLKVGHCLAVPATQILDYISIRDLEDWEEAHPPPRVASLLAKQELEKTVANVDENRCVTRSMVGSKRKRGIWDERI
ncbi:hypothetical protein QBC43DRAFT_302862 [Cladorrhinum sp. PSN259]|nr:hypothetical protein QBC43DRAFT_302862 [Cladorrhinum sp. PSN259]